MKPVVRVASFLIAAPGAFRFPERCLTHCGEPADSLYDYSSVSCAQEDPSGANIREPAGK